MSISRKNWSALSSLTRQWTVEDEEEVERERRRKTRTYSEDPGDSPTEDVPPVFAGSEEVAEAVDPEAPVDFVEMLRVRDERRRRRHMDVLRQQQEEEERNGPGQGEKVGGSRAGRSSEPAVAPPSTSDITETGSPSEKDTSEPGQGKNAETPTKQSRMFVSSLSISMDMGPTSPTESGRMVSPMSPTSSTGRDRVVSPLSFSSSTDRNRVVSPLSPTSSTSTSRVVSPLSPTSSTSTSRVVSPLSPNSSTSASRGVSPLSPTGFFRAVSPEERAGSPAPGVTCPVTQNGESQDSQNASSAAEAVTGAAQSEETAFQRNSPRAMSFRMARKKEGLGTPLQRSASVRVTSKATQGSKAPGQEEDSPFQRNSRQRISSRTIQEKMERLALAVQKSENLKSPSISQKGLYVLADEVSRKRGLFERDPAAGDGSPGSFRQDFRTFSAGVSDRINRWVARAQGHGSHSTPADLRNVDIASKKNIWENRSEEASPKTSPNK
ncbi:ladinin-1 [Anguilla anguilla]|uniref:ladinin-1 n=1 Tax=Anguilla anguilla TaxID=7936 RepID=UPI0015B291B4|nr:ladinin-1 [Anguilla anguilla]